MLLLWAVAVAAAEATAVAAVVAAAAAAVAKKVVVQRPSPGVVRVGTTFWPMKISIANYSTASRTSCWHCGAAKHSVSSPSLLVAPAKTLAERTF